MEKGKNIIHFTAEDIRRYLDGQLTNPEMLALEKAALEDPFLADAIAGLEDNKIHSSSLQEDLADLDKRLTERINRKNSKEVIGTFLSNWQIAASILIVAGLAVFTITYINKASHKTEIAKTIKRDSVTEKQNQVPKIIPDSTTVARNNSIPEDETSMEKVSKIEKKIYKDKKISSEREPSIKPAKNLPDLTKNPVMSGKNKTRDIAAPNTISEDESADKSVPGIQKNDESIQQPSTTIDEQLKGKVAGISIDKDGKHGSETEATGGDAFYNYINDNKKILTADSVLKGPEVISFKVHRNGKISSIVVLESVSPAHDAEILRLIESAPALKTPDGKSQKYQLTIIFK